MHLNMVDPIWGLWLRLHWHHFLTHQNRILMDPIDFSETCQVSTGLPIHKSLYWILYTRTGHESHCGSNIGYSRPESLGCTGLSIQKPQRITGLLFQSPASDRCSWQRWSMTRTEVSKWTVVILSWGQTSSWMHLGLRRGITTTTPLVFSYERKKL